MRAAILGALCLGLASCSNAGREAAEQAEREYAIALSSSGDPAELCAAATRAEQAWAQQGDQGKIEEWQTRRRGYCPDADPAGPGN